MNGPRINWWDHAIGALVVSAVGTMLIGGAYAAWYLTPTCR